MIRILAQGTVKKAFGQPQNLRSNRIRERCYRLGLDASDVSRSNMQPWNTLDWALATQQV